MDARSVTSGPRPGKPAGRGSRKSGPAQESFAPDSVALTRVEGDCSRSESEAAGSPRGTHGGSPVTQGGSPDTHGSSPATPETRPGPAGDLVAAFRALPENTRWKVLGRVPLDFDVHHPQGLVKRGDRFYMTSVETVGCKGRGWLYVFDSRGRLERQERLARLSKRYHPGGLDDDGTHLWTALAEYRPHSHATVLRIDPETLAAEPVFQTSDHLGAMVHNTDDHTLVGASWGSEDFYTWDESGHPLGKRQNPSNFVELQDCKYVGQGMMLGSGVSGDRGGLELYDLATGDLLHRVRVDLRTAGGVPMTRNPVAFELVEGKLRLYCAPEDKKGCLYVLEPR